MFLVWVRQGFGVLVVLGFWGVGALFSFPAFCSVLGLGLSSL